MPFNFFNWFAPRLASLRVGLQNRRNGPAANRQLQSSARLVGQDDREMMNLEAVANYAGVHPTTIRRWLREGQIPSPSARWKRKLYWTHDDAWVIKMHAMPGAYHSEPVTVTENEIPMDRNSTGTDVNTPMGECTI